MELCPIFVPYVGEASIRFVKALSRLCLKQFDVRLMPLYRTNKVGQYFQFKSATHLPLCSNVVYKFTCSCDRTFDHQSKGASEFSRLKKKRN